MFALTSQDRFKGSFIYASTVHCRVFHYNIYFRLLKLLVHLSVPPQDCQVLKGLYIVFVFAFSCQAMSGTSLKSDQLVVVNLGYILESPMEKALKKY